MKDYSHVKLKVETEKEEEIKKIEALKEKIASDFDAQLPKMVQDFCQFVMAGIEYKVERFYKNGKKNLIETALTHWLYGHKIVRNLNDRLES